jgi:hypothetical protein
MRLVAGTRKGLFFLSRKNPRDPWEIEHVAFLGDPVPMFLPDPRDGSIYAGLNLGHFGVKLHRSTDGGRNWEPCAVPMYPTADDSKGDGEGDNSGESLKLIWSLETAEPDKPGTPWCGTVPGGLFRSDDHGKSWQLNSPLWKVPGRRDWVGGGLDQPGIHSICVHPKNPANVFVGVSCGGVWVTENSGRSWKCQADGMIARYMPPVRQSDPNIQDAHRLVQSPADPTVLWTQHHSGIFHSKDSAKSWQEITKAGPSTFGSTVAPHPTDAATAWFVPAISDERRVPVDGRFVVTRTRDGGKSFETLTRGLPQKNAYHIAYRHALDVDPTGNSLAVGSTTGGLWTTDNAGDDWRQISSDLPLIYCLRFEN